MRYRPDATLRCVLDRDGRRVVLGGSPLRMWRLTEAGAGVVERAVTGEAIETGPAGSAVADLLDRFVDAGALHPGWGSVASSPHPAPTEEDLAIVVPVRDRPDHLDVLLSALGQAVAAGAEVVVVDDASTDSAAHERVARSHGARYLRRDVPGGPGAARDDGIATLNRPFVAVVDSDCIPSTGWLEPLLAHLADPRVTAVAPRVAVLSQQAVPSQQAVLVSRAADRSAAAGLFRGRSDRRGRGPSGPPPTAAGAGKAGEVRSLMALALSTYDGLRSPLDLGPDPARVSPGTRVSYVPAAALVMRLDAYRRVGGFDSRLRVGEDVDLVWRLVEAGWRVRYEPASIVWHPARSTLVEWLRQRVTYGSSAALLDSRHRWEVAPVRCSPWSAAGWVAVASGHPILGAGVFVGTAAAMSRRLRGLPVGQTFRIAASGHLGAGAQLARAVIRVWWPVAAAASVRSRRSRRILAVSATTVAASAAWQAHRSRPGVDVRTAVDVGALAVLDDVAYGAGAWLGCLRERSARALLPRFPRSAHRL